MKRKAITSAVMALCFGLSGVAFGQGYDRDHDHDHMQHGGPPPGHEHEMRGDMHHGDMHHDHEERGAGPMHDFHKGSRLPMEYRNRQYVVEHWREHHLPPPPRGYSWVQLGGDYVLISTRTGVITQIVLGG